MEKPTPFELLQLAIAMADYHNSLGPQPRACRVRPESKFEEALALWTKAHDFLAARKSLG